VIQLISERITAPSHLFHVTPVITVSIIHEINMGKRKSLEATLHVKEHTQENKNKA
jgi:hypothetical protein